MVWGKLVHLQMVKFCVTKPGHSNLDVVIADRQYTASFDNALVAKQYIVYLLSGGPGCLLTS